MTDTSIRFSLNEEVCEVSVRAGLSLLDYVRSKGLTGAKLGCQTGDCGACTMVVDGIAVQTCQVPLTSADGAVVTSVEGLMSDPMGAKVAQALIAEGAAQCGYCLPGIVAAASGALARDGAQTDISGALAGNICRCGTHHRILAALTKVRDALPEVTP